MPITTISYGEDVRDAVLDAVRNGETIHAICSREGMPSVKTVYEWAGDPAWGAEFARAREAGVDALVSDTLRIADDESADPQSRRVRTEVRRWLASKLRPDKYGDRTALQMLDEHGKPAKAGITIIVDGAPGE